LRRPAECRHEAASKERPPIAAPRAVKSAPGSASTWAKGDAALCSGNYRWAGLSISLRAPPVQGISLRDPNPSSKWPPNIGLSYVIEILSVTLLCLVCSCPLTSPLSRPMPIDLPHAVLNKAHLSLPAVRIAVDRPTERICHPSHWPPSFEARSFPSHVRCHRCSCELIRHVPSILPPQVRLPRCLH
jgi:hypothetical protein